MLLENFRGHYGRAAELRKAGRLQEAEIADREATRLSEQMSEISKLVNRENNLIGNGLIGVGFAVAMTPMLLNMEIGVGLPGFVAIVFIVVGFWWHGRSI